MASQAQFWEKSDEKCLFIWRSLILTANLTNLSTDWDIFERASEHLEIIAGSLKYVYQVKNVTSKRPKHVMSLLSLRNSWDIRKTCRFSFLWKRGIKICDSKIISSEQQENAGYSHSLDLILIDLIYWKVECQQWCVISHTAWTSAGIQWRWQCVIFSDSLRAAAAVLCHSEMQDQIRPWLKGLKWTQRCHRKVPENWLLETGFTQLVKKVHLPLWLLVNGCEGLHFLNLENYGARNVLIMSTTGPFTSGEDGGVQSTDLSVFKLSRLLPEQVVQPVSRTWAYSQRWV